MKWKYFLPILFLSTISLGAVVPSDKAELGTPKNFIVNGGAERGAAGFSTFADAAATSPVDGTGGSPSHITVSSSASSPISGARSLTMVNAGSSSAQGEGISYAFTIDTNEKAKVLQIDFDFLVSSGTFTAGSASTDSDMEVWVYDVTNSTLIQPSNIKLYSNNTSITGHFTGNFQTSATGTSYRLIFFAPTTATAAWTLKLDNISVKPNQYVYGTPITDWQNFPSTAAGTLITGSGGNPTYGTVQENIARWRREGDSMHIVWTFRQSTAGTAGTGTYIFNLPAGYTINTTVTGTNSAATNKQSYVGRFFSGQGVTAIGSGGVGVYSSTQLSVDTVIGNGTPAYAIEAPWIATSANNNFGVATYSVNLEATVPISGWSSSVQTSDSGDGRIVAAIISGDPASATVGNPIIVPTIGYDSHSAYNATTGRYTVPLSGIYKMYGALASASAATTLTLYKNASTDKLCGNLDSNGEATFACSESLVAGDVIDLRPGGTVDATSMTLNIERTSGPPAISASETISAAYTDTAGSAIGNTVFATYTYATKVHDTHNAYSGGTYTIPAAGKYRVSASILTAATTLSGTNSIQMQITQNGTAKISFMQGGSGASVAVGTQVSGTLNCLAGDTIVVQTKDTAGAVNANTNAGGFNYFSIERIGI